MERMFPQLIFSPIAFFEARVNRAPSWWLAAGGPLGCVAVGAIGQWMLSDKVSEPLYEMTAAIGVPAAFVTSLRHMGILSASLLYLSTWLLISGFLASVDVLFGESRKLIRILELSGLAFYSQWPWLLATIALASTFDAPGMPAVSTDAAAIQADLRRFKDVLEADATLVVIRTLNGCFTVWLYCLFGAGYHALTGVRLWKSLSLTTAMYVTFHLLGALL
jgi:hypothetical protein